MAEAAGTSGSSGNAQSGGAAKTASNTQSTASRAGSSQTKTQTSVRNVFAGGGTRSSSRQNTRAEQSSRLVNSGERKTESTRDTPAGTEREPGRPRMPEGYDHGRSRGMERSR